MPQITDLKCWQNLVIYHIGMLCKWQQKSMKQNWDFLIFWDFLNFGKTLSQYNASRNQIIVQLIYLAQIFKRKAESLKCLVLNQRHCCLVALNCSVKILPKSQVFNFVKADWFDSKFRPAAQLHLLIKGQCGLVASWHLV